VLNKSILFSSTYPSYSFTVLPFAILFLALGSYIGSFSVLFAIHPFSAVAPAVWPYEFSISSLLVFCVLTYIFTSVGPSEGSFAVHFVGSPFSFVDSSIRPGVNALSVDIVIVELTDVG
jgi:hypothetical protein